MHKDIRKMFYITINIYDILQMLCLFSISDDKPK